MSHAKSYSGIFWITNGSHPFHVTEGLWHMTYYTWKIMFAFIFRIKSRIRLKLQNTTKITNFSPDFLTSYITSYTIIKSYSIWQCKKLELQTDPLLNPVVFYLIFFFVKQYYISLISIGIFDKHCLRSRRKDRLRPKRKHRKKTVETLWNTKQKNQFLKP